MHTKWKMQNFFPELRACNKAVNARAAAVNKSKKKGKKRKLCPVNISKTSSAAAAKTGVSSSCCPPARVNKTHKKKKHQMDPYTDTQ